MTDNLGLVGQFRAVGADGRQSGDLMWDAFKVLVSGLGGVADLGRKREIGLAIDAFGVTVFGEAWQPLADAIPAQPAQDRPLFTRLDIAGESAPFQSALAMLQLAILMAPTYALSDALYAPVEALYAAFGIPNPADVRANPEHYPTVARSVLAQMEMHFPGIAFERPDSPEGEVA